MAAPQPETYDEDVATGGIYQYKMKLPIHNKAPGDPPFIAFAYTHSFPNQEACWVIHAVHSGVPVFEVVFDPKLKDGKKYLIFQQHAISSEHGGNFKRAVTARLSKHEPKSIPRNFIDTMIFVCETKTSFHTVTSQSFQRISHCDITEAQLIQLLMDSETRYFAYVAGQLVISKAFVILHDELHPRYGHSINDCFAVILRMKIEDKIVNLPIMFRPSYGEAARDLLRNLCDRFSKLNIAIPKLTRDFINETTAENIITFNLLKEMNPRHINLKSAQIKGITAAQFAELTPEQLAKLPLQELMPNPPDLVDEELTNMHIQFVTNLPPQLLAKLSPQQLFEFDAELIANLANLDSANELFGVLQSTNCDITRAMIIEDLSRIECDTVYEAIGLFINHISNEELYELTPTLVLSKFPEFLTTMTLEDLLNVISTEISRFSVAQLIGIVQNQMFYTDRTQCNAILHNRLEAILNQIQGRTDDFLEKCNHAFDLIDDDHFKTIVLHYVKIMSTPQLFDNITFLAQGLQKQEMEDILTCQSRRCSNVKLTTQIASAAGRIPRDELSQIIAQHMSQGTNPENSALAPPVIKTSPTAQQVNTNLSPPPLFLVISDACSKNGLFARKLGAAWGSCLAHNSSNCSAKSVGKIPQFVTAMSEATKLAESNFLSEFLHEIGCPVTFLRTFNGSRWYSRGNTAADATAIYPKLDTFHDWLRFKDYKDDYEVPFSQDSFEYCSKLMPFFQVLERYLNRFQKEDPEIVFNALEELEQFRQNAIQQLAQTQIKIGEVPIEKTFNDYFISRLTTKPQRFVLYGLAAYLNPDFQIPFFVQQFPQYEQILKLAKNFMGKHFPQFQIGPLLANLDMALAPTRKAWMQIPKEEHSCVDFWSNPDDQEPPILSIFRPLAQTICLALPGSGCVESMFSGVRDILTDKRCNLTVEHREALVILSFIPEEILSKIFD